MEHIFVHIVHGQMHRAPFLLFYNRAERLPIINTDIRSLRILRHHPPERVFNNPRGIMFIAHHIIIYLIFEAANRDNILP